MRPFRTPVLVSTFLIAASAHGQSPTPSVTPKPVPTLTLLLNDYKIIEAAAEQVGDAYRVRLGAEIRDVPAKQVLFAGESRADVQRFLAARAAEPPPVARRGGGGLNAAVIPLFAAKVQPILSNLCARCHCDPASAGGLVLERVPLGYADPDATRRNARAAASFVNLTDPATSPLLTKALAAHGDLRDPPLPSRAHPAFRTLELWVQSAAAPNGSPLPGVIPPGTKPAVPAGPATAEDPFSPDVFNRLGSGRP